MPNRFWASIRPMPDRCPELVRERSFIAPNPSERTCCPRSILGIHRIWSPLGISCRTVSRGAISGNHDHSNSSGSRIRVRFIQLPPLPGGLGGRCLVSHRATNCCQLIFEEAFHISRKNGLDRLAAWISPGVSLRTSAFTRPLPVIRRWFFLRLIPAPIPSPAVRITGLYTEQIAPTSRLRW